MFFAVNSVRHDKWVPSILTFDGKQNVGFIEVSCSAKKAKGDLKFARNFGYSGTTFRLNANFYCGDKAEPQESKSMHQYLTKLQRLSETCEFDLNSDDAIRDSFVCGLRSQSIPHKLLAEVSLNLRTTIEKGRVANGYRC